MRIARRARAACPKRARLQKLVWKKTLELGALAMPKAHRTIAERLRARLRASHRSRRAQKFALVQRRSPTVQSPSGRDQPSPGLAHERRSRHEQQRECEQLSAIRVANLRLGARPCAALGSNLHRFDFALIDAQRGNRSRDVLAAQLPSWRRPSSAPITILSASTSKWRRRGFTRVAHAEAVRAEAARSDPG